MKKAKLSTKFILLFTAVLTGIFAVMLAVVQLSMTSSMRGYIGDNLDAYHGDVDSNVVAAIDEVAYAYARIVRDTNADALQDLNSDNGYAVRMRALKDLATLAQSDTFSDVGWQDEGGYLSVNGYAAPAAEVFLAAEQNKNRVVVGGYANGCHAFVICLDNSVTETKGCFVFFMPETAISYYLTGFGTEEGYSYIIRKDGYVFSHVDQDYVGKLYFYENIYELDGGSSLRTLQMGDEKKIVNVGPMQRLNERYGGEYYLVSILDYGHYYGTFDLLTWLLVGIMVTVFLVGVLVAVLRAKKLSKPIVELNANIEETIRTGRKGLWKPDEGDELYMLEEKYDEVITHLFRLIQKNREDAEVQRQLELEALQMQINPHFLYNTLDAVSWMTRLKKEPEIEKLAVNLAKFFRLSLHKGDKFITVGEELELTAHFLEIDKIRFPDRVDVRFETDESLLNYSTLKLILQPIVENAVKYAFEDRKGHLIIRTKLVGGDIVFEVEDDGIGFDVSDDTVTHKKKSDLSGFGLKNVNERIKLEYGEAYGLEVFSRKGEGTKVTIRIQKRV